MTRSSLHLIYSMILGFILTFVVSGVSFAQQSIPGNCILPWGDPLAHSGKILAYSQTGAEYPKSCDDYVTTLSCNSGNLVGNRNAFKHKSCTSLGGLFSGTDILLNASFPGGVAQVAQYSTPTLNVTIKNRGTNLLVGKNIQAGFLSCQWIMDNKQTITIYASKLISGFALNPGTSMTKAISLKDIFTQSLGTKNITCSLAPWSDEAKPQQANNIRTSKISVVQSERFDIAMDRSVDLIKNNLDAPEIKTGADGVNNFLLTKVINILVPLIIVVGILISIFGFYKMLFSDDDKAIGDGIKYVGFGLIGIIVIMSAKYIATSLYSDIFQEGVLGYGAVQGYELAQKLYENIAFPFIKLAIYLSLGVLFVILASRVLSFIFGSDDDSKKKAGTIIARNAIGMLVIIGAKQVIEFIYGKQKDVVKAISNLGEVGSGILANKNLPILYQVINWVMGLASFVILVMVLVQAFQLLMKPDDPDAMKKIKNSLIYIFVGIIIIGTGYIITNFLIVN